MTGEGTTPDTASGTSTEVPSLPTVSVSVDRAVGRLTLNNPSKLNPLGAACLRDITAAAQWFDTQPDVKVVIVSGAGRAFTAGADLGSFVAPPADSAGGAAEPGTLDRSVADAGRVMAEAVTQMRAVTVASIHGHCVGGGVVLASACDIRVAASDVRFVIPEVALGIPLAWGGIPRLVREIGPAATRELVLSCRPFGAEEAKALGFVNTVADPAELEGVVDDLARTLASRSTYTLRATLQAVNAAAEALVPTSFAWSDADSLAHAFGDPESRAARRRYLESLGR